MRSNLFFFFLKINQLISQKTQTEIPPGAWGASRSGGSKQNLIKSFIGTTKRNLNDDVRISRIQRMIHMLLEVAGPTPATIDGKTKVKEKSVEKVKESGKRDPSPPKFTVENGIPYFGRVNLRWFAAWWNLIGLVILYFLWGWYYSLEENSVGENGLPVAKWEYRDPTRL